MTRDQIESSDKLATDAKQPWYGCLRDQDNFSVFDLNAPSVTKNISTDSTNPLIASLAFYHSLVSSDSDTIPTFADLTPQALSPFKNQSFLLMRSYSGWILRFIGDGVQDVLGEGYQPAVSLSALNHDLLTPYLNHALDRVTASPQLYGLVLPVDRDHELHGVILPLNKASETFDFVLVILEAADRVDQNESDESNESPKINESKKTEEVDKTSLTAQLEASRAVVTRMNRPSASSNTSLYQALAHTLHLYEEGLNTPSALKSILSQNGLKAQDRAPFTPLLKLVFGLGYDKTRLTEYAAALTFAWRQGIDSEGLVDYLAATPGGIKGCVKQERSLRRQKRGTFKARSLDAAKQTLLSAPAMGLSDLPLDDADDFALVLVRKDNNGSVDVVAPYWATASALETALRQSAKNLSSAQQKADLSDRSQPPASTPQAKSHPAEMPNAGDIE